jgi:single-strand DNA-binding protein
MANDINRVILIGRLTRDPELKSTSVGTYFCRFTLASNRSVYNKQTGESRDEVGYFDCIAWGKSAEIIHKYLQKGRRIAVEGSLRWSSWEGADGKKQSKVEIGVETFQFLEKKDQQSEPAQGVAFHEPDEDIPF